VQDRLAAQGDLDTDNIEVRVSERRVTLSGTVPDERSKQLAEEVAGIVAGVAGIDNRLRIRPV
jgi:osmotically-inducible protein OsmY